MAEGVTTPTGPSLGARLTHITRNTLLVTFLFGLAAVAGLFRNIIVAQEFGIGAALDAYYAAFKLPDLLFAVVAGGALATAFIPIFADFLTDGDRPGAWRLAAAITNLVVIVVGVLASIAWIFAPWLVSTLIAPGFPPPAQADEQITQATAVAQADGAAGQPLFDVPVGNATTRVVAIDRDSVGNLFVVAASNGGFLPGAAGIGGTDAFILRNPQLLFAQ